MNNQIYQTTDLKNEKTLERIKKIILEIQKSGLENVWANIILGSDQKSFSMSFYLLFAQMNSVSIGSFTFKNLKEFKNKKEKIIKKLKKQVEFIKGNEKNNEQPNISNN